MTRDQGARGGNITLGTQAPRQRASTSRDMNDVRQWLQPLRSPDGRIVPKRRR